ncbi:MAG: GMC family oxidoreductase [Actinobacteria bacterium]|nr:GMC family oxidoreductase [Actinomycetota bacterium]
MQRATATMDADVLIVGTGAGGATTAAILAEAGLDVLLVEEGDWVEQGAVVPFSLDQMDRQYRSGGVTVALGMPSIAYTEGCCAGGGTEVNSGLYWRPPGELLARWREQFDISDFDPDDLLAIADEVEADISVSTVPGGHTSPSEVLRRGADALGWRNGEIPRWMKYPPSKLASEPRSAVGERQSMTRTYLPRAMKAGARLALRCRVDRLVTNAGSARSAVTTLGDGSRGEITFRDVFVCGGAIQSPALLQRSGIRGHIGRTLAVHPTVKLAARFADALNVPDDVPVHQVKEFAPHLSFGGSASNPGLVALALLDQWATFKHAITQWRNISVYYAAITSEGRGRVRSLPGLKDPLVTYGLTHRDRELLRSGLGRLALLMLEAGATDVYPSFKGAPVVRNRRDLATMQGAFTAARASVMTVHLCSTVPMGEIEGKCGADSFGRVHGCRNIYVNDASLLPTAPGVNPQASVMAVAIRNARRFLDAGGCRG